MLPDWLTDLTTTDEQGAAKVSHTWRTCCPRLSHESGRPSTAAASKLVPMNEPGPACLWLGAALLGPSVLQPSPESPLARVHRSERRGLPFGHQTYPLPLMLTSDCAPESALRTLPLRSMGLRSPSEIRMNLCHQGSQVGRPGCVSGGDADAVEHGVDNFMGHLSPTPGRGCWRRG